MPCDRPPRLHRITNVIKIATAQTSNPDSPAAGEELGMQIRENLGPEVNALIVFASSSHQYTSLLHGLQRICRPQNMVGCSSAGEFSGPQARVGSASVLAIHSDELKFSVGVGRNLRHNRKAAAAQVVSSFQGPNDPAFLYRSALILADALAGYTDDLIEDITVRTVGHYQFFGGGAGDDANFLRTVVFAGTEVVPDAAVALEILSNKPIGIGSRHGWQPVGEPMLVTASDGMRLISINGAPAVEAFKSHANLTGQNFNPSDPIAFFLHNVLGVQVAGNFKLRVPLSVKKDGSIICASDVRQGATVQIMGAKSSSAREAMSAALEQLGNRKAAGALFFDCVATRLRLGKGFDTELSTAGQMMEKLPFAGCNTYGQIVRAPGQFNGFHNCNAVACVFPE